MTLQAERLRTMGQVRAFVQGSGSVDYQPRDRAGGYAFVRRTPAPFDYRRLGRADRGRLRACIGKACPRGSGGARVLPGGRSRA